MADTLSEAEVVRIATILSEDTEAVEKKERIYGHLGLLLAELEDLKKRVYLDNSDSYGFFTRTLSKYWAKNGSQVRVTTLTNLFTELNLTRVVEKIGRIDVSKGVWFMVEFPVESFTGRETELETLHQMLNRNTENTTVINQISIVAGLGGVGKSELVRKDSSVRKYAADHREYYGGNVLWINSENESVFRNSIFRLFEEHFNIYEKDAKDELNENLVARIYDRFSTKDKCLIIFDNVEEFDMIGLLPRYLKNATAKIPNVLITSRNTKWKHGIQVLSLDVFTIPEATCFVKAIVENAADGDVLKLAKVLQCLPLALQQAVAYIRAELSEHFIPIEKYLELFGSEEGVTLLDFRSERLSDHEQTTFKTWMLTLKSIKTKDLGPLAIRIMNMVSCFEPDYIPGTLFANLDPNADDVIRAIALLKSYSMIRGPVGIIHVHRLTQRVVRLNLEFLERKPILQQSLELLEEYMGPRNNDEFVRALVPHAVSVWRYTLDHDDLIQKFAYFVSDVCKNLIYYGRYGLALGLSRNSKLSIERILGNNHAHTIIIKLYESWGLYGLKEYSDSMEILQDILPMAVTELGHDHWAVQAMQNLRAMVLGEQGKTEERLEVVEQIADIQLKKFGLEEPDTQRAQLEKGNALLSLGKVDEAIELITYVFEQTKKYYGEGHEETNITENFLTILRLQKQFQEKESGSEPGASSS